jgi:hypothetical protein
LDAIIADLPADKEIHVILDNYCTHKRNDDWLAKYGTSPIPSSSHEGYEHR